jgi:hypothetical protein
MRSDHVMNREVVPAGYLRGYTLPLTERYDLGDANIIADREISNRFADEERRRLQRGSSKSGSGCLGRLWLPISCSCSRPRP